MAGIQALWILDICQYIKFFFTLTVLLKCRLRRRHFEIKLLNTRHVYIANSVNAGSCLDMRYSRTCDILGYNLIVQPLESATSFVLQCSQVFAVRSISQTSCVCRRQCSQDASRCRKELPASRSVAKFALSFLRSKRHFTLQTKPNETKLAVP